MGRTSVAVRTPAPERPVARPESWVVALAAVVAVLLPLVQLTGLSFPGRSWLALLFFVLVPGAPLVAFLRLRSLALVLAMTFAVSLSSLLLLSTFFVKSEFWHPQLITLLTAAAGLGLTVPAVRLIGTPAAPRLALGRDRAIGLGVVAASLILWVLAVDQVDLSALGGLGLAEVVGPLYWLGLALLSGVFGWQLTRAVPDPLLLAAVVVAVVIELLGFLNAADSAASLSTGWLHVGFAQYIADHGAVAHDFDARFSWPGFFASTAVLVKAAGTANGAPFLAPAHVVDVLLVVPALWSIARTITRSDVVAWLSLGVFLALNWYEQDYFSPQAGVYVLYVGVLALLLHLAPEARLVDDAPWRHPFRNAFTTADRPLGVSPRLALGREGVLLLVCSAVVVSHQLTPLNLMMILVILVITGATRYRGLWLLVTVVFIAYFTFGAQEYWRANASSIFGDIGKIGSTVGSAVGNRLTGDPVHSRMQTVRLGWSALSVLVALFSLWTLRRSTWFWILAGTALGPFGLVFVQSYGGEVALRCFLYADPVLAPLIALVLWRLIGSAPARTRVYAVGLAFLLGWSMLTLVRGANASFERQTTADTAASRYIFEHLVDGQARTTIGTLQSVGFAGFEQVTRWELVSLDPVACAEPGQPASLDVEPCILDRSPDYLIITGSMEKIGVLSDGEQPGWSRAIAQSLISKDVYEQVFRQGDAVVLRKVGI
jgi:hypothetical protein